MMSIKDTLNQNIKEAMRARNKDTLETLRLITAAIKQIEVDERIEVDDARTLQILDKLCKQRKESITQFESANRDDLVAKEKQQLEIIQTYLPQQLTTSEVSTLVADAIRTCGAEKIADMGKVMAILKPQMQGRADMAVVSSLIKSQLQ